MLAAPLNALILQALVEGPKQQAELRRLAGSPPQTTLRAQLKKLVEVGAVDKQRRNRFPGVLDYELTEVGQDLVFVVAVLQRWLDTAPDGPLPLGGNAAKAATKALAEGWSTTMLRALAAGPLSLTELDRVIASLSYPSLERRLGALRLAGQLEACSSNGRGTPYAVTDWLRQGVAPLGAAARWEQRHQPQTAAPIGRLDVETAFLLVLPLWQPPQDLAGACQLAVELPNDGSARLVGVTVEIADGTVTACATDVQRNPDTWAHGPVAGWLDAIIERSPKQLKLSGNRRLAGALLDGLSRTLFGPDGRTVDRQALDVSGSIGDDGSN